MTDGNSRRAGSGAPYQNLPPRSFWRTAVAQPGLFGVQDLHRAKFRISPQDGIITAGSCFAQHVSRALSDHGYNWLDAEPAPPMLSAATARRFGYGVFSCRTGNIYSAALLRQWLEWAFGSRGEDREIWHQDGRWFDPVRPAAEPDGFASAEEVWQARERTLRALRQAVKEAKVFIFTMGQTETWVNAQSGLIYQMCPGTQAGAFDADLHQFINQDAGAVQDDMAAALSLLRSVNPELSILLTVSPVPLTATAAPGAHALAANGFTKAVLRAAAGSLAAAYDWVDYFPSYELLTAPAFGGLFFEPNKRTVAAEGVAFVMRHFLNSFGAPEENAALRKLAEGSPEGDSLVCEEMILDYYRD
ncbi:GSCFA domain-containing protein (plasmid) [Leisingera sp. M527]|uniref:GSCFA domain-containing protein n=1 Tax=Leisingera sp. M527 TaxID=2867014 RepID=UPI0021A4429D|nr:GSCFA domain-containing protein [Leisingera sp. M527]UWQ35189.1 GSCFA domain-containing protein [Leisingera sp. M527]